MLKHLLTSTAILLAITMGALAQTADQPAGTAQPQLPQAPEATTPPTDQGAAGGNEAATATPPPSDAVIAQQGSNQLMADKLIGMTVYSGSGEQVGKVSDILVDKDGKVSGIVLSVGGFLGMGGKPVALTWQEVRLSPDEEAMQVSYSQDQLSQAPEFKTKDQVKSETSQQSQQ